MKKLLITIVLTVSIICVLSNIKAYAASTRYVFHIEYRNGSYHYYVYNCSPTSTLYIQYGDYRLSSSSLYYDAYAQTLEQALDACASKVPAMPDSSYNTTYSLGSSFVLIITNGINNDLANNENIFSSYDDFINPPSDSTWYSEMWDTLKEKLGDPAFWFGEWFIDIIDNVFGNDEGGGPSQHSVTTHVHIEDPTLTPAPTPIPYSTVVIPKTDPVSGDTYYETNYYYNNPSGTPIIQPYPPTNPPSANSPSGGNEYNPIGGDPYSIPVVSWLTSATIGDSNYDGIDSVGSGLNSIDEIGSEYTEGMSAVQDSTGTLPTSWILLIGVAAAIPLVAGLISRFLS